MSGTVGSVEGGLQISVEVSDGIITAVDLCSTRPVGLCATLVGRNAQAAITLLPRLFSLCGVAQTVAGLTAAEAALGIVPSFHQTTARRFLVATEALEQTVWRFLLDWSQCLGDAPNFETLKRLRPLFSALRPRLFATPAWNRIGGATLQPNLAELEGLLAEIGLILSQSVYGITQCEKPAPVLPPPNLPPLGGGVHLEEFLSDRQNFEQWLIHAKTPVARLLRSVCEQGLADFGRSAILPLPPFDAGVFEQRLAIDTARSFCARPDLEGTVYETGALAQQWQHPLIADFRAEYGNGLLVRLVARLIESHVLLGELRTCLGTLAEDDSDATTTTAMGTGLGIVECARGRLLHRAITSADRIVDYQILAPTEWNFHPNGSLMQGLTGASVGDSVTLHRAVNLLVMALDPCVSFELTVQEC